MRPVVQLERTGCGIASAAAIAGISYRRAQSVARSLGIVADNKDLWSKTEPVRALLESLGLHAEPGESPFRGWQVLPDLALLSIKWHLEKGQPFWHWVVFVREGGWSYVLDSKGGLRKNVRTDFGRMKPKWYIRVADAQPLAAGHAHQRASPTGSRA